MTVWLWLAAGVWLTCREVPDVASCRASECIYAPRHAVAWVDLPGSAPWLVGQAGDTKHDTSTWPTCREAVAVMGQWP